MSRPSSISSNDSFVVVYKEKQDAEGNPVTELNKPIVTFEEVFDEYPSDLDLITRISFEKNFSISPQDTVLLLPVGWISLDQAVCAGELSDKFVRFVAKDLPKTDGCFQIVYVAERENLMGVSDSFCFVEMSDDELVEFVRKKNYSTLVNAYRVSVAKPSETTAKLPSQPSLNKSVDMTSSVDLLPELNELNSSTLTFATEGLCSSVLTTLENSAPEKSSGDSAPASVAVAKTTSNVFDRPGDSILGKSTCSLDSDRNSDLIRSISDEVEKKLETFQENWKAEKQALSNEITMLKETVRKYEEKLVEKETSNKASEELHGEIVSDSDSSDTESFDHTSTDREADVPVIYGITPTYARPEQKPVLIRLSHTLRLVPNFHWIVVEDAPTQSADIAKVLSTSGISYTHLAAPSPPNERRLFPDSEFVVQRNAALRWLRQNKDLRGIVYFVDDYKIYCLEIFEEMRSISKVGVWPVGLAGGLPAEKPILSAEEKRVIGWNSRWRPDRSFPIDATACAINLQHLMSRPRAWFSLDVAPELRLSAFLSELVEVSELEPKAKNCTEVYVWHVRNVSY